MKKIVTDTIPAKNAVNILRAFQYASSVEAPLDLHYTVAWSHREDYPRKRTLEEQCSFVRDRTDHLKRHFADFCRHHQLPNHLVYVHENDQIGCYQNLVKLAHTHIAVHVPTPLRAQLLDLMRRWASAGLAEIPGGLVHVAPHETWHTICHYLLKGSDITAPLRQLDGQAVLLRDVLRHLAPGIAREPEDWVQGEIHGKRCGMSKQLDAAARACAGFVPPVIGVPEDQRWTPEDLWNFRFQRQMQAGERWVTWGRRKLHDPYGDFSQFEDVVQ